MAAGSNSEILKDLKNGEKRVETDSHINKAEKDAKRAEDDVLEAENDIEEAEEEFKKVMSLKKDFD